MESRPRTPATTVVIPCHSIPVDLLREAIESVKAQTISDWEAIIVDDGALDFSVADLVEAIGDPRLHAVEHQQNRGLGAARNTGFEHARAPLVAMLDADDRLHPEYLQIMTASFGEPRDDTWGWPDIELFGESSGEWVYPDPPPPLCPAHLSYSGGSSLIPRSLWVAVGGFVEDPLLAGLEDLDFWLGALETGAQPLYVREALYDWRISGDSMTSRLSADSHLQMKEIYRRRRAVFDGARPCPRCAGAKPGSAFLAHGYFNASVHAQRTGHRFRSLAFGLRGWLSNPANVSIKGHLRRLVVPSRVAGFRKRKS